MRERLDQSINAAADYIEANQQISGSFQVWNSEDPSLPPTSSAEVPLFPTACVVYSLGWLHTPAAERIRSKALAFLRAETIPRGLYQYFISSSTAQIAHGQLTLPLATYYDVDTTACVSSLLQHYGTSLDNKAILLANRDQTGLFQLWLMNEPLKEEKSGFPFICFVPHQNRTCSGVTANALMYLGESDLTLASAERLTDLFIRGEQCESSPYYPDEIVLFYLYSRAYFAGVRLLGKAAQTIIERLREYQQPDGSFGSPMQTAMALCTQLNFDRRSSIQAQSVQFLLDTQAANGSWKRSSFYIAHDEDIRQEWRYGGLQKVYDHVCAKLYFGSEEITTAYCLEALSRYREAGL